MSERIKKLSQALAIQEEMIEELKLKEEQIGKKENDEKKVKS